MMQEQLSTLIRDPFVAFCALALIVPPFWVGLSVRDTLDYFCDPYMLLAVGLSGAVYYVVHVNPGKKANAPATLTAFEQWRARWYLLNGLIIHGYLDGLIGAFRVNKLLTQQYNIVDKRFGAAPTSGEGSALFMVSSLELFLYAPLCVWLYVAFYRKAAYRSKLEVCVSTLQLGFTLLYAGQEVLFGFKSVQLPASFAASLTLHYAFYFWFAVVIGISLWIVIPGYLIYNAFFNEE